MIAVVVGTLTWTFAGPAGGDIMTISAEGDTILAASMMVAYYSIDGGSTWNRIDVRGLTGIPDVVPRVLKLETAVLSGRMFLFHSGGYLYSDDGSTWIPVGVSNVQFVGEPSVNHLFFIAGNSVYEIGSGSTSPSTVFTPGSSDTVLVAVGSYDSLWFAIARVVPDSVVVYRGILGSSYQLMGVSYVPSRITDVEVDEYNTDTVMLGTLKGLYVSGNGGASFASDLGTYLSDILAVSDVEMLSSDSILIGAFYFPGLYKGYRGYFGWTLDPVYTDAVVRDIEGQYYLAAFGRGVVYWNGDNSFEERTDGLYANLMINPGMFSIAGNTLAFINGGGVAYYTTNGGTSWNQYNYKMDGGTAIEISSSDPDLVLIGGMKASGSLADPRAIVLAKSTDGGQTFEALKDTFVGDAKKIVPVEISVGSNPDNIFLISGVPGSWIMEHSSDGGSSFDQVMTSNAYNGYCFTCVDTLILIVGDGDVYVSYDAGSTWESLTNIGTSDNVYVTYKEGLVYYSTGKNAYVKTIDLNSGTIDSIDLSSILDTVMQVQVSSSGDFFLTGFVDGVYKIAYTPDLGSVKLTVEVEDAPALGGLIPLEDYVLFYSPYEGAFYTSPYPTGLDRHEVRKPHVQYAGRFVIFHNMANPIKVYRPDGRLIRVISDNKLYTGNLPRGVYVATDGLNTVRIVVH